MELGARMMEGDVEGAAADEGLGRARDGGGGDGEEAFSLDAGFGGEECNG